MRFLLGKTNGLGEGVVWARSSPRGAFVTSRKANLSGDLPL